jgi:hypothetical protein
MDVLIYFKTQMIKIWNILFGHCFIDYVTWSFSPERTAKYSSILKVNTKTSEVKDGEIYIMRNCDLLFCISSSRML